VKIAKPLFLLVTVGNASIHRRAVFLCALALACLSGEPLQAQNNDRCFLLCTPSLKFEPTWTVGNLFRPAKIARLENGEQVGVIEEARESKFESILALDIPTEIPRLDFSFEAIWAPLENTDTNVFTGGTASGLGKDIRDNPVELEFEANFRVLEDEQTGGWVSSHFDIVDQYSPSKRPRDRGLYTHKLNFEFDTAFHIFNWLPQENWLRNLELEFSLDYLATGLPKKGDRFGDEVFLRGESPWSLSILFIIPIAPLRP
jgi:hypothetical protein